MLVFWMRGLTTLGTKAGLTEEGSSMEAQGCEPVRQPVPADGSVYTEACGKTRAGKGRPASLFL